MEVDLIKGHLVQTSILDVQIKVLFFFFPKFKILLRKLQGTRLVCLPILLASDFRRAIALNLLDASDPRLPNLNFQI